MSIIRFIFTLLSGIFGAAILLFIVGYFGLIQSYKIFVVMSGSMEPALKVGSIAIVIPSSQYSSNDIITFSKNGDKKNTVTHRIVSKIYKNGNMPAYLTSGDANKTLDTGEVAEKDIVGKVFLCLPYLGYFVNYVKDPKGFILFVIVPITIILYEELKTLKNEFSRHINKIKKKKEEEASLKNNNRGINKAFIFVPVITIAFALASVSGSFFTDQETSTENVLSAGVWITPTPPNLANHIVISEVQTTGGRGGGSANLTDKDFIEIYNPTSDPINLNGYRLVKRTGSAIPNDTNIYTFSISDIIPAHGYYLWASSESPGFADLINADVISSDILAISNNSIAIRQGELNGGTIIDALSWSSVSGSLSEGTLFTPDLNTNQSMERKAYSTSTVASMMGGDDNLKGNGYDSENNINDFILRTVSEPQNSGSPTETP